MTDNRTTELREKLTERGVEHYDGTESTLWLKDEHGYRASADELSSGRLSVHIWCDTPEQAIAATLGGGKLTAEQVREAWCGHLRRDCLYDPPTPDWQAIADELNAELGSGTCEFNVVEEFIPGKRQRSNICECSNCGYRCAYGFIVDERFKCC
ncbi:MAG: hypothetical protein IIZ12_07970, partial [Eggerthellaceae bacterium]|nr:hypothetical protein [Eggerthellaceae bacterium]